MPAVDYFQVLGLEPGVEDPVLIETAYRERKRLWDGRRHNPAYRHEYLLMQETIAEAFAALRDPESRARHRADLAREAQESGRRAREELTGLVRLAIDAGYLTPTARQALVEKGMSLGLSEAASLRVVLEVALESGARSGRPGGIEGLSARRETFRWFVARAVAGRTARPLAPGTEAMLAALAEQFGFGSWRLSDTIEDALAANRRRRVPDRVGRFLARLWVRFELVLASR